MPLRLHAVAAVFAAAIASVACAQTAPSFDESAGQTLFAFDEQSIPFTQNLKLEMATPAKYAGNPVVVRGAPGTPDSWAVQFYGSVIKVDGKYRMWYVASGRDENGKGNKGAPSSTAWRIAYAESADGIQWTKPNLGLVDYAGNSNNNLVKVDPPDISLLNVKVIHDPEDPDPARRYKMAGHAYWTKQTPGVKDAKHGTLATFVSPDGLNWKSVTKWQVEKSFVLEKDLLIPETHMEPVGGFWKWDGVYYLSGQNAYAGPRPAHGRVSRGFASGDFVTWTQGSAVQFLRSTQHQLLGSGRSREGEQNHEGISVWPRGNVLLGAYGMWHGAKEWPGVTIDLGLVLSNDGVNFREPQTEYVLIKAGPDKAWDQGGLLQGQGFEHVGDQTFIYYGAWDPRDWESAPPRGGVGIATLPRDRFAALVPNESNVGDGAYQVRTLDCDLLTAPIKLKAGGAAKFYVNADGLAAGASLKIELLDAQLKPLPGYSGKDTATVNVSGFHTPIQWASKDAATGLPDRVRIKATYDGPKKAAIRFSAFYVQ